MAKVEEIPMKTTLEGTLLKDSDPFPYFMLVALEASSLLRFTILLLLWPLISLLRAAGRGGLALRVMVFAACAGVREAELAAVARAVLPKFYFEDLDAAAWQRFSSRRRRAVVTAMPTIMAAWFAKAHLGADQIFGPELAIGRFGLATGFLRERAAPLDLGRSVSSTPASNEAAPKPVIFHDGRLVRRPTAGSALLVLLWIPLGIALALVRMAAATLGPFHWIRPMARIFGGELTVRGKPPPTGVLFVCNHRTVMDGITIAASLRRRIPSVTYSVSRLTEILSPVKLLGLTREREADAKMIKAALSMGDLVMCPEGTTCREPFLLRFSMLFAELTDRIVPVAVDCRVGMFHPTTARGWKAMDVFFFLMNPRPAYEITFLDQLPMEETCAGGKRPQEVANYVQGVIADALGFERSGYTRRDKYMLLAGNEGLVSAAKPCTPGYPRIRT
ncbi:glycerol-3-phosphate acyltransferase 5-like [Wolffia australiana]